MRTNFYWHTEGQWLKEHDPDPDQGMDSDPLVRGTIPIRIRTKMSRTWNSIKIIVLYVYVITNRTKGYIAPLYPSHPWDHRVHISQRRNRVSVSAHSAGAYTATLLVMVNVIKRDGRAPPPSPARANFTLMTECTPESSGCNSVYSVPETDPLESGNNNTRYTVQYEHKNSGQDVFSFQREQRVKIL
jgi:hypothetical protein